MTDIVKVPNVEDRYKPFVYEVDPSDTNYEVWKLTKVEPASDGSGWWVNQDSAGCFLPRITQPDYVPAPKVGDTVRVYGGWGSEIQGHVLNGRVIWYRTDRQRRAKRANDLARWELEKQERFKRDMEKLDAQYETLPEPFRRRLDRFRAEDDRFRVDSESYESFILQQAALLASHFKTEEELLAWDRIHSKDNDPPYDYAEFTRRAPEGWSDGHSGNTHGAAIAFARALMRGETEF